jgi:DNA polymerase-3 subunit epsilon
MIFHREEPRNLAAAARFYLGSDFEDAHSALADIRASADVFWAQLERYGHVPRTISGLHRYCDEVSPFKTEFDRWFRKDGEALVFLRGKYKGRGLHDVATEAPDYLQWMLGADEMDPEVLEAVRGALR